VRSHLRNGYERAMISVALAPPACAHFISGDNMKDEKLLTEAEIEQINDALKMIVGAIGEMMKLADPIVRKEIIPRTARWQREYYLHLMEAGFDHEAALQITVHSAINTSGLNANAKQ